MLDRRAFIITSAALAAASVVPRSSASGAEQSLHYRHTMFFNFKDDIPPATLDRVIAGLKDLGKLPYVKGFFIGRNALPKLDITPFQWLTIFDFASEAERKEFLKQDAYTDFVRNEIIPVEDRSVSLDIDQPLPANISAVEGIKIRQVGLFNFKDSLSEAERERVLDNLKAQADIPGIKSLLVARNILPKSTTSSFEWMFMSEFASEEDNAAWRSSPEHKASEHDIFGPARSDLAVISVKI